MTIKELDRIYKISYPVKLGHIVGSYCRNPSIWLATKARRLRGCGPRSRPESHITCSRECKESRECEGMNPHTPKWTPMLGVGESWSPKRTPETSESVLRGQNSMAGCAPYINGKLLKCRCLNGLALLIWTSETQVMAKRRPGSRTPGSPPVLTPDH